MLLLVIKSKLSLETVKLCVAWLQYVTLLQFRNFKEYQLLRAVNYVRAFEIDYKVSIVTACCCTGLYSVFCLFSDRFTPNTWIGITIMLCQWYFGQSDCYIRIEWKNKIYCNNLHYLYLII